MRLSLPRSCLILLLVIAVMERALFALGNLHFGDIDGYSRAMSLHVLNAGGQWQLDGSVALLSPLALISGLPPETVVRFSNPLFSALLVVAVGTCVFRLTRQLWAACIGCGLIAIAPLLLESTYSPRIDIAGAYTILALASLGSSALAATCAALIVLLSGVPTFEPLAAPIACVLLAALLGKALGRVHSIARQVLGLLCSILFSVVLLYAWTGHVPEGALQYEASARACAEIARRFTRNTWLVVSTTYERPFIYGRGWHLEMVEFVSTLSVEQVGNPEFVFPYSVRDLFLFLENQPLRQSDCENCWQNRPISVSQTIDIAVQSYVSPIGRASVEFSAAALIAAYLRSHRDLSVFYSDEHLTVYRVHLRDR